MNRDNKLVKKLEAHKETNNLINIYSKIFKERDDNKWHITQEIKSEQQKQIT